MHTLTWLRRPVIHPIHMIQYIVACKSKAYIRYFTLSYVDNISICVSEFKKDIGTILSKTSLWESSEVFVC